MKKKIKLIGLDLDGTVFNEEKKITDHTKKVIEYAIKQGIVVLPATGRPQSGLPEEFLKIPGVRYALTSNGARIVDLMEGKVVYEEKIPWELTQSLMKEMDGCPEGVWEVYFDGKCYVEADTYRFIEHPEMSPAIKEYIRKSRIFTKNLKENMKINRTGAEKLHMVFSETGARDRMMRQLQRHSEIEVSNATVFNVEINSIRAGKGKGLVRLGEILGIGQEEIMACGDSSNDWSMLKSAGFAVAMGNADEKTKSLADFVTKSNEEDGVAYAIESFVL